MLVQSIGGASAAKEPGHFEVKTFSSQVTQMDFFPHLTWRALVYRRH